MASFSPRTPITHTYIYYNPVPLFHSHQQRQMSADQRMPQFEDTNGSIDSSPHKQADRLRAANVYRRLADFFEREK